MGASQPGFGLETPFSPVTAAQLRYLEARLVIFRLVRPWAPSHDAFPARVCHLKAFARPTRGIVRRSTAYWNSSMTKLYVGNLPFSATEDTVRALFAEHGTVEKVALINDRDTGQPRGFGFVEMSTSDAQKAMQALSGRDFGGRPRKVNEAQEKQRGGGGGGYNRR